MVELSQREIQFIIYAANESRYAVQDLIRDNVAPGFEAKHRERLEFLDKLVYKMRCAMCRIDPDKMPQNSALLPGQPGPEDLTESISSPGNAVGGL